MKKILTTITLAFIASLATAQTSITSVNRQNYQVIDPSKGNMLRESGIA